MKLFLLSLFVVALSCGFAFAEDEVLQLEQQDAQQEDAPPTQTTGERAFVKPAGPAQGGMLRVPHPDAAKGLLRINKDGSYQYKVGYKLKSQSSSLRVGSLTPPRIAGVSTATGTKDYKDYYGSGNIFALFYDYEWQPFTKFGRLGLNIGSGFATTRGNGYFKTKTDESQAPEVYSLYVVPLSTYLVYRFEYARRQWVVPYLKGGGTYFGLVELRDDNKTPVFAGAPAAGGGGGLHFSISALDAKSAFALDREYGISDMYFTVEAMALQGLSKEIDFSTQTINAGITVDF